MAAWDNKDKVTWKKKMKSTWKVTFRHKDHYGIWVVIWVSATSKTTQEVVEKTARSRFRQLIAPSDGTLSYTIESAKRLF